MICLKQQAYDVLDGIHFDHKMEENGPVSLFSAMNTSIIGGDASVPFTDTAGQNPPDFHVAYRGKELVFFSCPSADTTLDDLLFGTAEVETAHHANIYQAHELPQAFRNNNNAFVRPSFQEQIPCEQYGLLAFQGWFCICFVSGRYVLKNIFFIEH